MKKILITIISILVLLFLIPMPHGGTIGGNILEGVIYEINTFFSQDEIEERKKQ